MPKDKQQRPRLILILTAMLIVEFPLLIFLGLNLLTNRWSFLTSWFQFWEEFRGAVSLFVKTPGEYASGEILFFDVVIFSVLVGSGIIAFFAGIIFTRGKSIAWILGLIAQIGTLASGLILFFMHQPPQAFWLLAIGIIMVLYLNYGDVRQWFLQADDAAEEEIYV